VNVIKLHDISFIYPNGNTGVSNISLDIPRGKKIALLGANGSGKTTLLMLLNGIFRPSAGEMLVDGQELSYSKRGLRDLRRKIGVMFHESDYQLFAPSVYEEISFGLTNISTDKAWIREKVHQVLEEFNLAHLASNAPHALSTGQKKWVVFAAILAMDPGVIICDEPAASLDPRQSDNMFELLDNLHRDGKTIIISTHDIDKAYEWADIAIVMHGGSVASRGECRKILRQEDTLEACGLRLPRIVELYKALNIDCEDENPINTSEMCNTLKIRALLKTLSKP